MARVEYKLGKLHSGCYTAGGADGAERRPAAGRQRGRDKGRRSAMAEGAEKGAK